MSTSTRRSKKPSTLLRPDDPSLLPSDDEDDDFVAPDGPDDGGSGSDSSDDEDGDGGRPKKRAKTGNEVELVGQPTMSKEDVDDLWASFNAPDPTPTSTLNDATTIASTSTSTSTITTSTSSVTTTRKKIKITVEYQFVGETVIQEKEVWEDSVEAKNWLASRPRSTPSLPSTSTTLAEDDLFGPSTSLSPHPQTSASSSISASTSTSAPLPPEKAKPLNGAPRRPKSGGLSALAASLSSKPAKLNTLEKSKLDWNKFVEKEEMTEDLEKARKDGYLEKMDFLQRTEDRREEGLEKGRR